jgi:hypothetical protein
MPSEGGARHEVRSRLQSYRGAVDLDELDDSLFALPSINPQRPKSNTTSDFKRNKKKRQADLREIAVTDAKGALGKLAADQRLDHERGEIKLQGSSSRPIFDSYRDSGMYKNLIDEIRTAILAESDPRNLRKDLAGRVFEDLVFGLLSQANTSTNVLLSPQRTFELVKLLIPGARVIRNNFGHDGLTGAKHIFTPDGLSVTTEDGEPRIAASLEYSLSTAKDWNSKYRSFREATKTFPEIFTPNPRFVAVVPQDYPDGLVPEEPNISVLRTGFSSSDFRSEVNNLIVDAGVSRLVA